MNLSDLAHSALQILSPFVVTVLTWLAARIAGLVNTRVKNEYLRGVLIRLDDAVFAAVREVHQVAVEGIKASSQDGTLTPGQKAEVKARAIATIKSHLGLRGLQEVAHVLGIDGTGVDTMLSTRVEAAVHDLKRARVTNGVNASPGGGDYLPFAP